MQQSGRVCLSDGLIEDVHFGHEEGARLFMVAPADYARVAPQAPWLRQSPKQAYQSLFPRMMGKIVARIRDLVG